jgi:hypothetical protein
MAHKFTCSLTMGCLKNTLQMEAKEFGAQTVNHNLFVHNPIDSYSVI